MPAQLGMLGVGDQTFLLHSFDLRQLRCQIARLGLGDLTSGTLALRICPSPTRTARNTRLPATET